jgi:hypothetical protein
MENKINIAEILKDCPKGMELYSPIFGELKFNEVNAINNRILVVQQNGYIAEFESDGRLINCKNGECLLFPSKGKTTWEGFHKPFKDGDIVVTKTSNNFIFYSIYKGVENREVLTYADYYLDGNRLIFNDNLCSLCLVDEIVEQKLATEEEKTKLFDAIKSHGYKWNPETKTLEKLTPNKFDISTLKAFDKVLVRDNNSQKWTADLFSFYDKSLVYPYSCVGHYTNQCVPYEENQHLLGTTNDCDEFYKTWE